ncbi:MAG: hypothetical protein P1U56_12800 [Saprospiraceae bacterium]|nr:hypothetical protein [Saprospiraceae bacterium]
MLPDDISTLNILQENKRIFEKIYIDYLSLGVERGQISKSKNIQSIASLIYTMHNGLKVITKVNFDEKELIESVDTLLSILD